MRYNIYIISEEILPFEEMLQKIKNKELTASFPVEYTLEQLAKIKK